jgi:hypothetical protein
MVLHCRFRWGDLIHEFYQKLCICFKYVLILKTNFQKKERNFKGNGVMSHTKINWLSFFTCWAVDSLYFTDIVAGGEEKPYLSLDFYRWDLHDISSFGVCRTFVDFSQYVCCHLGQASLYVKLFYVVASAKVI